MIHDNTGQRGSKPMRVGLSDFSVSFKVSNTKLNVKPDTTFAGRGSLTNVLDRTRRPIVHK